MELIADHEVRTQRARLSLEGLSLGDAYGMHFEFDSRVDAPGSITAPPLPDPVWKYTDDTEMALSIYAHLRAKGTIDSDDLADSFAKRFTWARGYGSGASRLLEALREGASWRELSPLQHNGAGSCGNGAAMRMAPLGAFFADDPERLVAEAERASVVTHWHPDGVAGGIAVALAASQAVQSRSAGERPSVGSFLGSVLESVPPSPVRAGLEAAAELRAGTSVGEAVDALGNGSGLLAADTVPFALWAAATYLDDFVLALQRTASGLGDADTNCAIVGGIVSGFVGSEGLPADWFAYREPLPGWIDG